MPKYHTDKVVKLQGKEYVLFEGLLEVAQNECKLKSIVPKIIQLPSKDDPTCIFEATVTTEDGKLFVAHGDASPTNVNKMIALHLIRMAETRAVARALRFLTGFGTAFEELGDMNIQPQSNVSKMPLQANKPVNNQEEKNPFRDMAEGKVIPVSDDELKELFGDDLVEAVPCNKDQQKKLNLAAKDKGYTAETINDLYAEVGYMLGYKITKFADVIGNDVSKVLNFLGKAS